MEKQKTYALINYGCQMNESDTEHYAGQLKELGYDVVLYLYNPNIYPLEEYKRRLDELKKFSEINNAHLIVDDGDYDEWKILISGLENEPEKGKRCAKCFQIRLKKTVEKGLEQKCDCFATTHSVIKVQNKYLKSHIISKQKNFPSWKLILKNKTAF